jgi:hypothetical protein
MPSTVEGRQSSGCRDEQLAFATPATIVYALGAVLLLIPWLDRRSYWTLGALLQGGCHHRVLRRGAGP